LKQQETTRDNRKEQVICFCGKATAHVVVSTKFKEEPWASVSIAVRQSAGNNKGKTYCGTIIHDRSFKVKM